MNRLAWFQLVQALLPLVMKLLDIAGPEVKAVLEKVAAADQHELGQLVAAAQQVDRAQLIVALAPTGAETA